MKSTEKELLYTEKQRLIGLYEVFHKLKKQKEEEQLSKLFLKVAKEEFAIAFCGHFSAGKSSLINALSNTGILPSSPIPTSANIVKMIKGDQKAVVQLKNKEIVTFEHPYDVNEIKALCKDSDLVESIEIYYESKDEDINIAYYDTPGIDSTDPAHKKATEDVIYLADLIFYVMDYNHILSETNIGFIQSLIARGKAVRLIVNQIDKHREEEINFHSFKENVFKAFQSFGIPKEDIFFTSVKNPSFSHNDLPALIAYIKKIEMNKDAMLLKQVNNQLQYFVKDFIEKNEEDKLSFDKVNQKINSLIDKKNELLLVTEKKEQAKKEREESIRSHFIKMIDSAQLMPYETREKAGLFIESAKKDFKVGLFFSKHKTEQERNQRTIAFQETLQQSIDAQINWHAQNYMNALQKEIDSELPDWQPVEAKKETLYSFAQSGLSSQGQGLLNYCNSISSEIKRIARHQMSEIIAAVMSMLDRMNEEELLNIQRTSKQYEKEIVLLMDEKEKAADWEDQKLELHRILSSVQPHHFSIDEFERKFRSEYHTILVEEFKSRFEDQSRSEDSTVVTLPEIEEARTLPKTTSLQNETERLSKTTALLKPLSGLSYLAEEMDQLRERLDQRSFTMVLFGAFSAGKSSFANALFGEQILPSSPNPTTAAINEIRKPVQNYKHGTIVIEMKTKQEIVDEVNLLLETKSDDLKVLESDTKGEKNEKIQSYIAGFNWANQHLGKLVHSDLSEIGKYAADETKACFIKKITIYYSCPLTDKGLVLVDTPGANSIHSRHTEVAFEYMKHADIIIYLTYFNHAFSYADREFLIQLGRIKDTFTSDKMFFAINASDLAENEEDERDVVLHVKNNLQTFGIRNPRLFPLSSKNELLHPERRNSGFDKFTESLFHYIEHDLESAMIRSAQSSINHAKAMIENIMIETEQRIEKEDEYLETLHQRERFLLEYCSNHVSFSKKHFYQEQKELLYYIRQRVLIRYHDFYKETIHPAAVQSSKSALQACIKELFSKVLHDLHQEFRACSLRLDKWIQKSIKEKEDRMISEARDKGVSLQETEDFSSLFKTPTFSLSFVSKQDTDYKEWLSYFKTPKQFFEQSGSNDLKNALVVEIEKEVEHWLSEADNELSNHYETAIDAAIGYSKSQLTDQILVYFEELKKPGDLEGRIQQLQKGLKQLEQI